MSNTEIVVIYETDETTGPFNYNSYQEWDIWLRIVDLIIEKLKERGK